MLTTLGIRICKTSKELEKTLMWLGLVVSFIVIALTFIALLWRWTDFKVDRTTKRHGGELVARVLSLHSVSHVFTLCGGHISPILVACNKENIKVVPVRDEKNAVFAAEAYSKITDIIGVAIVTAGPGVTNTVTAMQTAKMSETAVLLIGGCSPVLTKGRGALQDMDQLSIFKNICKRTYTVSRVKNIIPTLMNAIKVAKSGCPGPVFVELPVNILYPYDVVISEAVGKMAHSKNFFTKLIARGISKYVDYSFDDGFTDLPLSTKITCCGSQIRDCDVEQAGQYLKKSQRPVILVGGQILSEPLTNISPTKYNRSAALNLPLIELGVPVYMSGSARGFMGSNRNGFRCNRNLILREADFILLLGVSCDFRLKYGDVFNKSATIVMVNLDKEKAKMNQNIFWKSKLIITGHPYEFVRRLASTCRMVHGEYEEWIDRIEKLEKDELDRVCNIKSKPNTVGINPVSLLTYINSRLDDDSVVICDGGDFVGTASTILKPRAPFRWLDAGPYGSLGVGAGYAVGAHMADANTIKWIIYGDGACGFSLMEFYTFMEQKIPVIAVIGNDGCYSQIERDQTRIFNDSISCMLEKSKYHLVAEIFGGVSLYLSENDESKIKQVVDSAIEYARSGKPVIINAIISKTSLRDSSISL